jgi:hypothetical protein
MIITYHGYRYCKLQVGDTVISIDPPKISSAPDINKSGAAVVVSTVLDNFSTGVETNTFNGKEPFWVSGPGEYEIDPVHIMGFPSGKNEQGMRVTSYLIRLDGLKIVVLGGVKDKTNVSVKLIEETQDADVVIIPIGKLGTPRAAAYAAARTVSPNAIIPIFDGDLEIQSFIKKDAGQDNIEILPKYTFRKKDLEMLDSSIVLIEKN